MQRRAADRGTAQTEVDEWNDEMLTIEVQSLAPTPYNNACFLVVVASRDR